MSQEVEILRKLESGATLTPLDALREFGCFRLAARCLELKRAGHDIETIRIQTPNGASVAGYRLKRTIEKSGQVLLTI